MGGIAAFAFAVLCIINSLTMGCMIQTGAVTSAFEGVCSLDPAFTGGVFAVMVFIIGDAAAFLAINIPATILVVMVKGIAAGLVAGLLYRILAKKNKTLAAIVSSIAAPLVNTGIFAIGGLLFFMPTIESWGLGFGYTSGIAYLFFGMIGLNFLVEFGIAAVLSPVIVRMIDLVASKKLSR